MKTPELLLPVGTLPMALAAIHAGADAVYVGAPGFNARGRSQDFTLEELKELIDHCHLYGVKVHLAFNVLVFQSELPRALELVKDLIALGPDAFIVQDLGLVQLIRALAPWQRVHGSTQMTVTNDEAMALLEDLKIERYVLGRENSLPEIKLIREKRSEELEVFVHGALCVAYSGQCFTSEAIGGRSANRGQCAQSCRLGYELFVDGEKRELGDKKYLVSPQDLCGIEHVPALRELGVDSFKIEGRLKGPEYVTSSALNYRRALDGEKTNLTEMATSYSRGFFDGWLRGVDHQRLVEGSFSSHRGLEIGVVKSIQGTKIQLTSRTPLRAGQGLFFASGDQGVGSKIFLAQELSAELWQVELLDKKLKVSRGQRVWLNSDEAFARETKKLVEDRARQRRVPIDLSLKLAAGEALELEVFDGTHRFTVRGPLLAPAQKEVNPALVWQELLALSHTAYKVRATTLLAGSGFVSSKDLKALKREMIEKLNLARTRRPERPLRDAAPLLQTTPRADAAIKLNLVLREKAQVEEFLASDLATHAQLGSVILDYEFGKDYRESVALLKKSGVRAGVATTRILKPREYYNLKIILAAEPDVILVRNLGALHWLKDKGVALMGDFSLNVSNHLSANYLLAKGLESVCISYDLNQQEARALVEAMDASRLELTVHQYMPEFHMEHCVFAAFMSKGSSFKDCGKPCEKHHVELKDAYGKMHFLKADQECRNTMFKGEAQSAAFVKDEWPRLPSRLRFEALHERGEVLLKKIRGYLELVSGARSVSDVVASVGTLETYGVSAGQLLNDHAWRDRKKSVTLSE